MRSPFIYIKKKQKQPRNHKVKLSNYVLKNKTNLKKNWDQSENKDN